MTVETSPVVEVAKPQIEVMTPQEVGEKKRSLILAKFQKAQKKFSAISSGLKQVFDKITGEASHVVLDVEQHQLYTLLAQLEGLSESTTQELGVAPEAVAISTVVNGDVQKPQTTEALSANEAEFPQVTDEDIATTNPIKIIELEKPQPENGEVEDPSRRAVRILQELQDRAKAMEFEHVFATKGMLGDSDKIEGHQIDFIYQGEKTIVSFKMTSAMTEKVKSEVIPTYTPDAMFEGSFDFQSIDGQISSHGECWVIRVDDNTTVYISKGEEKGYEQINYDYNKPIKDAEGTIIDYESTTTIGPALPVRALMGAARIEIQGLTDVQKIAGKVDTAFQKLKIEEALIAPDQLAENQYKEARYRWQHRVSDDQVWQAQKEQYYAEHGTELVDHLERVEVFPEYFTIIDKGASERYQKKGRIFLIHSVYRSENLVSILQNGLLSSQERFNKGIFTTGMSTERDFGTGGADYVFIRAVPESAGDQAVHFYSAYLLINPEVLNRTDWFAYHYDSYGTTEPQSFDVRPSPEDFLTSQREFFTPGNEIMMRRGIPTEMISGVVVDDEYSKSNIITNLQEVGIKEVNGVPLDKFIIIASNLGDLKQSQWYS